MHRDRRDVPNKGRGNPVQAKRQRVSRVVGGAATAFPSLFLRFPLKIDSPRLSVDPWT